MSEEDIVGDENKTVNVEDLQAEIERLRKHNETILGEKKSEAEKRRAEEEARKELEARISAVEEEKKKAAEELAEKEAKESGKYEEWMDAREKRVREELGAVVSEQTEKIQQYEAMLKGDKKQAALNAAIDEVGVVPHFKRAVKLLLDPVVKVEQLDDGSFDVYCSDDGMRTTVKDYVKNWALTEEGKVYVSAPANSGGGFQNKGKSGGATVSNPWAKGTRNVAEQNALIKSDKAKAIQLMKEANVSPAIIAAIQ